MDENVRDILGQHDLKIAQCNSEIENLTEKVKHAELIISSMQSQYSDAMAMVLKLSFQIEQLQKTTESLKGLERLTIELERLRLDFEEQRRETKEAEDRNDDLRQKIFIVIITAIIGAGVSWIMQPHPSPVIEQRPK
jgi:chromosome segregation ATPase